VAAAAAEAVVGAENVNANCDPLMGSEDFGAFIREVPGCFVFLGSGKSDDPNENPPIHNSLFDYNDDVLEIGAEFFAEIIRARLPE
jgi:hippurate hydrolase